MSKHSKAGPVERDAQKDGLARTVGRQITPMPAAAPATTDDAPKLALVPPAPLPEGAYVVMPEVLERLGNGDIKHGRRTLRQMIMDAREPKQIRGPTERPVTVRVATIDDEQDVYDLLLLWWKEHAAHVAPIAPERLAHDIKLCTRENQGTVAVVDDNDGRPVGVILMVLTQWSFSNAWFIRELYTFVHPDHRKSRHAQDLVQFGKWSADEWSRQFGYQMHIVISVLTQDQIAPKIRFFRRFLTQMGAGFLYPAPSAKG